MPSVEQAVSSLRPKKGAGGQSDKEFAKRNLGRGRDSQLTQFALADFVGDREEAAIFSFYLTILGQNIFNELGTQRIEGLLGQLVDVNI
jgi:hypothetical protein